MSSTISSNTTGPVVLGTADNPLYITSTGTVTSTGSADGIDGGAGTTWTITNAGVVSAAGGNGVSLAGSGIVGNTGSMSGNDALVLHAGGSVTNDLGGSISGLGALGAGLASGAGVYITGAAGTVTNNGTISGPAYGVGLDAGGQVTNTSSITGGEDGVIIQGAIGTIANSGNIIATVDDGVALFAGGSVTNASGASISGLGTLGAGIFITGGVGTVTNAGSIAGPNHHGVLIAGGGSLSNAATGSISALGAGVFFETNPGTVTNAGYITGTGTNGTGVYLENGGSATNTSTGIITGNKFGAFLEGAFTTLANYGSISGATYDGAVLGLGGIVTNAAGASISGASVGVYVKYRAAGTVTNSGSISAGGTGSAGIDLADGGSVTNNSTGSVSGNSFGVFVTGAVGTVTNTGSITSVKYGGVELVKGGSVTNSAGASINGGSNGVYAGAGTSGTVTNSGSINAANASGSGVDLAGGGSITNNSGGSISGGGFGVFTTGALGTLANYGSISGSHGVGLEAGGSVTNAASASISGQAAGVFAQGGAATLSNAGSISATAGAGADIEGGGSITNLAGATISGSAFGVFLTGGSGTVTNAGTISGGTYAIDFAGSATNRLVVDPGAVFVGSVTGGSGTNTLELARGTGSIGGVGTGSFNHFQVLAVDAGATWTLSGANIAPTVLDNGTVSIAGSLDVSTAVDAGSTGLFQLGSGATLEVAAATGTTSQISFQDSTSELIIDNAASFGTNVGIASYAGPQLQHFVPGDTIDLKSFSSAGVTLNYNASTGVLQVSNSANQVASLQFQTSSLGGTGFAATSDGATGIFITDPAPAAIEALGSTSLVQVGGNYFLDPVAGGIGPELKYNGSPVTAGEFGTLAPIGAEQTTSGYEVAWKIPGANQYTVWNTDSSGNNISTTAVMSGTSFALETLEPSFHQDLNGDGVIGVPSGAGTVIEVFGSTSLVQVGNNYYLDSNSTGTGPEFKFNGAPFVAGEFGAWTLIGAEQVAGGGYDIAWKVPGADQYTVWSTDSNGNFVSAFFGTVSGTSTALESFEPVFHQDLNGDGTIGLVTKVIQTDGSTSLTEVGNNFYFYNSSGSGPEFKFNGAPFVAGEFGAWTLIGAVQVAGGGYDIAWKVPGADQYTVWSTDSNGNFVSAFFGTVSGTSTALESFEPVFHQDLNGDGVIGPPTTVIESFGSTSLVEVGNNFFFENSSGSGPEFKFNGAPFVAGEFGAWTLIGAEQVAGGGYDIAWKVPGADQYTVWSTDSNGNFVSAFFGTVSGTSTALESFEPVFHQDLNGDGVIGPPTTVIESFGSTSLVEVGNNFFFENSTGTGPEFKFNGAPFVAGEFGAWTLIGAEQVAGGGYDIAWKVPGADQYTVWSTDSNGNFVSAFFGTVSGTSTALESFEPVFHQDLNGDGVIGPPTTVIESFGSTSLVEVGNNFFFENSSGSGPEFKFNGAPFVAGEFGAWTLIGAEQVAGGGYDIAWKVPGADQYTVWSTDSNGNFVSAFFGTVSGTSTALESFEPVFHQDLNGDGVVFTSGSGSTVGAGSLVIGAGASVELTGAYSGTITFAGSSGTLTNDNSANFSGKIAGQLAAGDVIDLADITAGANATITYSGNNSPGTLTVGDGIHTASISLLGNYSLANFTASSDGHGGTSIIDPPLYQANSNPVNNLAGHAPLAGPAPPAYATRAALLDQYMAASSCKEAPGICQTSLTTSQQAWLGDKEFLTRPHG